MPLSYNNNTPQGSSTVASTQSPILTNFQSIDKAFNGQGGSGSGGGNFTTYTLQNTTANFASKPLNPTGILSTIASSVGNPELVWLNNINATGAGPYNGTRLTGGGITAAVWCQFDGTLSSPITPNESYNMAAGASITVAATGNYILNFNRPFATTNYCVQVLPSFNETGTSVNIVSRQLTFVQFIVKVATMGVVNPIDVNVLIFGTLA